MNRQPNFGKLHWFKAAILLYLSSMERVNFVNLQETQLVYLVIKLMKHFAVPRACTRRKIKRGIGIIFFVLNITLMLSRMSCEPLMSISNKHNYKAFSKSPPASLTHCIGTRSVIRLGNGVILWQWLLWVLPVDALSFTFVQYLFTDVSLATA